MTFLSVVFRQRLDLLFTIPLGKQIPRARPVIRVENLVERQHDDRVRKSKGNIEYQKIEVGMAHLLVVQLARSSCFVDKELGLSNLWFLNIGFSKLALFGQRLDRSLGGLVVFVRTDVRCNC